MAEEHVPPRLVLASASPRRRDLLGRLVPVFDVRPADVDESHRPGEAAEDLVARLAATKAEAGRGAAAPGSVVLGADTIVVLDGDVLGKPVDGDHASAMLGRLSGRTHRVLTGVAVAAEGHDLAVEVVTTEVTFRTLTTGTIAEYVASGEPLDKAGAYGIQGGGGALVASIDGPFDNVVGLPLDTVRRLLARTGVLGPTVDP
jgi:nucleoside triphosphate pyrophosphatase